MKNRDNRKGEDVHCYDRDGAEIDITPYLKSSKGVSLFYDESSRHYGLKDRNGDTITAPKYHIVFQSIWLNDFLTAGYLTTDYQHISVVIDATGKEIFQIPGLFLNSDDTYVSVYDADTQKSGLFRLNGTNVLPVEYKDLRREYDWPKGWYIGSKNDDSFIYNAEKNKFYPGNFSYSDGMFHNYKENYYINAATRKRIDGGFKDTNDFSEGLAVVQKKGNEYSDIIDRNGKIIVRGDKNHIQICSSGFSEGVLAVSSNHDDIGQHSYIYNPLGHEGFSYNQAEFSNYIIELWRQEGHREFKKKNYAKAKDYFYRIMMNRPDDVNAVQNYASSLQNMGHYEEALEAYNIALDMDSNDDWTVQAIAKVEDVIEQNARQAEGGRSQSKTDIFLNALSTFANLCGNMANTLSQNTTTIDSEYLSSPSVSGGNYQSRYQMWEQCVISCYNSLTNLGYSANDKRGNHSGSTGKGMSSGNYVSQKHSLRQAQREMQKIRQQAARDGVTITPSKWETATVSF